MTEQDHKVIKAMLRYGGSFVQCLAECAFRADPINLAKIKATWPDIWEFYTGVAKREEKDVEFSGNDLVNSVQSMADSLSTITNSL